ncbi:hypothetical protein JOC85_002200 [Bacillus mesophilus]|uniref:Uncharacterized protein n=1 Tax=Bacillus mesophilus TaxID=1808955 RepID=A0A6M0Q972_9BACI|nr:hypothetical protein [Bacillus mesophilus]MBM7661397.1 hypothetical protein [Bacillus mesophilus]NEY72070.1 hypothetical protein [Bacillus mesophilus]
MTIIFIVAAIVGLFFLTSSYLNRNWVLYTTTFGYQNYFQVINRLQSAGIIYKTKTPLGAYRNRDTFEDYTQYDIYIKKEDQGRALQ